MQFLNCLLAVCVLSTAIPVGAQTTWYVDEDAPDDPGPGDPTIGDPLENGSMDHPFDTIQEGIAAAANGHIVRVLDGMYTGDGNRDLDFGGKLITVRSENGPENCTIDCEGSGGDPHRGFYFHGGETNAAVLNGFTIRNGYVAVDGVPGGRAGGGVLCSGSNPTITNCKIIRNRAENGGGISCIWSSPKITNCLIAWNTAGTGRSGPTGGGGIRCDSSNPIIANCAIIGNTAWGAFDNAKAGAIYLQNSAPTIVNCTVSGNTEDDDYCSIYCYNFSDPTITNCVLWGNEGGEVVNMYGSYATVSYSNVEDGYSGTGNINADPWFADSPNGNYRLSPGSPCIDAGNNTAVPPDYADQDGDGDTTERIPLDLDGNLRFVDDPDTDDTGVPDPPDYPDVVDMGAYEGDCEGDDFDGDGLPDMCDPDIDDDGVINDTDVCDYTPLGTAIDAEGRPLGDIDRDCDTDLEDYRLFQQGFTGPLRPF